MGPVIREHNRERLLFAAEHAGQVFQQARKLNVAVARVQLEPVLLHALQGVAIGAVLVHAHGVDVNHCGIARSQPTVGGHAQSGQILQFIQEKLSRVGIRRRIITGRLHGDAQLFVIPSKLNHRVHLHQHVVLHRFRRRAHRTRERVKHLGEMRRNALAILQRVRRNEPHGFGERVLQRLLHARARKLLAPDVINQQLHRNFRRLFITLLRGIKPRNRHRIVKPIHDGVVALLQHALGHRHLELHRPVGGLINLIHDHARIRGHGGHRARAPRAALGATVRRRAARRGVRRARRLLGHRRRRRHHHRKQPRARRLRRACV